MARLVLTNNKTKFEQAIVRNVNAGFEDYSRYYSDGCYISVHKKRIKKIENFFELPNGDFCSVVGTCIYKNSIGTEALNKIFHDFNGDIEKIRANAIGNYLMAIRKNNRIVVFVDKYQIIKTYFFHIGENWFITNSLADIGDVLDEIKVNEFAFMQETMLVGAIGTQSIFENVFRLFGHRFLEIDCSSKTFLIKDLPYSRERRSFECRKIESAVDEYAEIIKSKFEIVAGIFGNKVCIHQTGGLDTRTVFSSFMSVDCKPKIAYGVGNSILTNTKNKDYLICKDYQKKFDLCFYEMNWRDDFLGSNVYWHGQFNRYGFNYALYAGSRCFFSEYEGGISDYPEFFECGYFLENLRLRDWAKDTEKEKFSVEEFTHEWLLKNYATNLRNNTAFYANFDSLAQNIIKEIKIYKQIYKIELNDFVTLQNFDQTRYIHTRCSNSHMVNFLNDFAPSIAMFSLPDLHEFPFDVPAQWRANGRFQMMVINKLFPEALDIPVFSHCRNHRFDKKTFTLTPEYSFSEMVGKKLRQIGVPTSIYKGIKGFYGTLTQDKKSKVKQEEADVLKKYLVPIINEHKHHLGTSIYPESYEGSIVFLMIFAQYLYGISVLKEKLKATTGILNNEDQSA